MPTKFADYQVRDRQVTDADFYNRRLRSIDGRIASLEDNVPAQQAVIDDLRARGLQLVNESIGPNLARIQQAAELGFLQCPVRDDFEAAFAPGQIAVPLRAGPQRDVFAPTAFVALVRTNGPGVYAICQKLAWDKAAGVLTLDIVSFQGSAGPHPGSELVVEALSGGALAVRSAVDEAAEAAATAQAAISGAQTARSGAETARTGAQAAQSAAEAARAGAETARSQAQAAAAGGVKVTANDTSPEPLDGKIAVSGALTKQVSSPGGDESLSLGVRTATTAQTGAVRLATQAETDAATAQDLAVTPAGLGTKAPLASPAFTGRVRVGEAALSDGASIATNAALANVFTVTLAGNRTLANPTNLAAGSFYTWRIRQDATGGRALAFGNAFKWPAGAAPTLSTTANALDILSGHSDGTNVYAVLTKDLR